LDWVAHALSSEKFVAEKTHQLLGHVLSCVYDEDIHKANFHKVKDLLQTVDNSVAEKIKA
jgi:hypothetical protein